MLDALKRSPESSTEIELAKKYIVGIIGDLQRRKRLKEEKASLQSSQHTFASEQAHGPRAGTHPPLQTFAYAPERALSGKSITTIMINQEETLRVLL